MLQPWPQFIGPSYSDQNPITDCEQCINWYPEIPESAGASAQNVLYPTPGYASFASVANGPCRALFYQDGRCFAVIGSYFYELASNGTLTQISAVAVNANPATICSNGTAGNQIFITCGDHGYIFNLNTSAFTTVIASGCTVGTFFEGFFLALDSTTSTLKISALNDGTSWDPTQVAQRSAASDKWIGMVVVNRDIWLLGTKTSEAWYNAGTFPFPFQPNPSGFIQQGMAAIFSCGNIGDSVIWLGASDNGTAMVWRSNGYTPVRVSNHALEYAMSGYGTLADATAYTYQDQGHHFYVLTFPTANVTWVYDIMTNQWHQRGLWNSGANRFDASRALYHCYSFNKHLVGDRLTGTIWTQDIALFYDVDGLPLRRLRRSPHLSLNQAYAFYHEFQIVMQVGVGLVSGQGSDPQIMIQWSNDGGRTFSSEVWESAGQQNNYSVRVRKVRVGRARQRVFQVTVSDPVGWRLTEAYLDVEQGVS